MLLPRNVDVVRFAIVVLAMPLCIRHRHEQTLAVKEADELQEVAHFKPPHSSRQSHLTSIDVLKNIRSYDESLSGKLIVVDQTGGRGMRRDPLARGLGLAGAV